MNNNMHLVAIEIDVLSIHHCGYVVAFRRSATWDVGTTQNGDSIRFISILLYPAAA